MAHASTFLFDEFKTELLNGSHAFGTQSTNSVRTTTTKDTFNGILLLASDTTYVQTLTPAVYSATGELAATGNYTAKGALVTNANAPAKTGATSYWTPSASLVWTNLTSSGAFDCVVLMNNKSTSTTERLISLHAFGSQSITAGTLTITMPTNDASTGLIRIG